MKRLTILAVLAALILLPCAVQASEIQYDIYPWIRYMGDVSNLPAGENIQWSFDCRVLLDDMTIQHITPTSVMVIDRELRSVCAFDYFEIERMILVFHVEALDYWENTVFDWSGTLDVSNATIEERAQNQSDDWAFHKCYVSIGDFNVGFYTGEHIEDITDLPATATPLPTDAELELRAYNTLLVVFIVFLVGIAIGYFAPRKHH